MSDDLREKHDALVAAARAVCDDWETGLYSEEKDAEVLALAALLPEPLRCDDMVTQADADRVPAGAILRDTEEDVWRVTPRHWLCAGFASTFAPSEIDPDAWPMRVVWLPEDGEQ